MTDNDTKIGAEIPVKGLLDVFKRLLRLAPDDPTPQDPATAMPTPLQAEQILARYASKFERDVRQFTTVYMAGRTNDEQWITNIGKALFQLYFTSVAASAGNVQQVRQEMLDDIGNAVLEQKPFLQNFARQIETDKAAWDVEKVVKRLLNYRGSAKPLISKTQRRAAKRPDLPFDPADRTLCYNECKCHWGEWVVLDAEEGDYDVPWVVRIGVEHCPTCIVRAEVCSPLQIRGGIIVTDLSNPELYRE